MELSGYAFGRVCDVEPDRTDRGVVDVHVPQSDYDRRDEKAVHDYGWGPFCSFGVPDDGTHCPGVYAIAVEDDVVYVGETKDLYEQFANGYGRISPANCFAGGQQTNCRLNTAIFHAARAGDRVSLHLHATDDFGGTEEENRALRRIIKDDLVTALDPAWNKGNGTADTAASEAETAASTTEAPPERTERPAAEAETPAEGPNARRPRRRRERPRERRGRPTPGHRRPTPTRRRPVRPSTGRSRSSSPPRPKRNGRGRPGRRRSVRRRASVPRRPSPRRRWSDRNRPSAGLRTAPNARSGRWTPRPTTPRPTSSPNCAPTSRTTNTTESSGRSRTWKSSSTATSRPRRGGGSAGGRTTSRRTRTRGRGFERDTRWPRCRCPRAASSSSVANATGRVRRRSNGRRSAASHHGGGSSPANPSSR
ncbi:GIY-YIG nuclease family protein [Halogeometricum sp. CBA1124]|uniref:GIY-YIG nuclease family protein n=1 Tax=Halogeometricum sp. CBA1124 TaxID=2668071 RepID=UPI001E639B3B|nr:GIY-YIG nuclease family protein [Halogeometricum sp. CBA1124]